MNKDKLFAHKQNDIAHFAFNKEVAHVFEDMIQRSVPGYSDIIQMIGLMAQQHAQPNTNLYDLGCSLGASSLAMAHSIKHDHHKIIAIDNSEAMIAQCKELLLTVPSDTPIDLVCEDIQTTPIKNASMVILNFTLQFIKPKSRDQILHTIYQGLLPQGICILSEKVKPVHPSDDEFYTAIHKQFKKAHGYSELEISQKRSAIENVLISDTKEKLKERLLQAGFSHVTPWYQNLHFISMVAHK